MCYLRKVDKEFLTLIIFVQQIVDELIEKKIYYQGLFSALIALTVFCIED